MFDLGATGGTKFPVTVPKNPGTRLKKPTADRASEVLL